jgi:hypothetical protein
LISNQLAGTINATATRPDPSMDGAELSFEPGAGENQFKLFSKKF